MRPLPSATTLVLGRSLHEQKYNEVSEHILEKVRERFRLQNWLCGTTSSIAREKLLIAKNTYLQPCDDNICKGVLLYKDLVFPYR